MPNNQKLHVYEATCFDEYEHNYEVYNHCEVVSIHEDIGLYKYAHRAGEGQIPNYEGQAFISNISGQRTIMIASTRPLTEEDIANLDSAFLAECYRSSKNPLDYTHLAYKGDEKCLKPWLEAIKSKSAEINKDAQIIEQNLEKLR